MIQNMNNADSDHPQATKGETTESSRAEKQAVLPKAVSPLATLTRFKGWLNAQGLPAPATLAAAVAAAFLIFPAYWGLVSGQTIRQLREQISELQQSLKAAKGRSHSLDMELSQQNLLLLPSRQPSGAANSGLFVSPLVSLEPKRSKLPDLIRISFAHSDQAVLVFYPPTRQVEEIEVKIYRQQRLVWNQVLPYSSRSAASPHLVTLILSASVLSPGNYQLDLDGNLAKQRTNLAQFDLTVEK